MDPRIGLLLSGRCYCFPEGYAAPEFIGTRAECEVRLGVRAAPRVERERREFVVTVTPTLVVHAGSWRGGSYEVVVYARTHAEAISSARRQRRDEEGRFGVPATFRARLVRSGA